MNTKYELGNVIRSSASFANYAFPAELPTEEWKGSEARSYDNYIRPIANLFENDRESEAFIKSLVKGIFVYNNSDSVVYGCTSLTTANIYYEITEGVFIYHGTVYHVFPACEAAAKQIESAAELKGHDIKAKIWYDNGTYYYSYSIDSSETVNGSSSTAVGVISAFTVAASTAGIPSLLNITDSIILPIFTTNNKFYFDGYSIKAGETVPDNALELNVAPNSEFNGAKIVDGSLENAKLQNSSVIIGETEISLGSSSADFVGISSINGIESIIDNNGAINIAAASSALVVPKNYTLNDACTRAVESNSAFTENDALPVVSAVKGYINNYVNTAAFTGNNIEFQNGINISGGKLKITDSTDATASSGAVSELASIYTAGGIESKGSICSEKNIIGLNSGTYSSRAYKENITPFTESAVDLINTIDIVNYTYKADEEHNHKIGFIADDTHEYFATKNHNIMDQSNCIGLLLKAVQELSAENAKLREELNGLKS